ncbi:unnamed protein product [Coregonus sp. 'balchen']|nr:unnamed protein product [Coregonus sp. 'balchen']
MDINEMTKPWGLEVDRVELTVGGVLKPPEDSPSGLGSVILPPLYPLVSRAWPDQYNSWLCTSWATWLAVNNESPLVRTEDSISFSDEVSSTPRAISCTEAGDGAVAVTRPTPVLELLKELLLSESLVNQVGACFLFLLQSPDGQQTSYYVDLSQGSGSAGPGPPSGGPGTRRHPLSMTDQDLLAMFKGTLRPFAAYTTGTTQGPGRT